MNVTNQRYDRMASGGNRMSGRCGKITHKVSIVLDYQSPSVDTSGGGGGI